MRPPTHEHVPTPYYTRSTKPKQTQASAKTGAIARHTNDRARTCSLRIELVPFFTSQGTKLGQVFHTSRCSSYHRLDRLHPCRLAQSQQPSDAQSSCLSRCCRCLVATVAPPSPGGRARQCIVLSQRLPPTTILQQYLCKAMGRHQPQGCRAQPPTAAPHRKRRGCPFSHQRFTPHSSPLQFFPSFVFFRLS